jgi:hypothetical protein
LIGELDRGGYIGWRHIDLKWSTTVALRDGLFKWPFAVV